MIKKVVVSLCLILGLTASAQEGSSSPYSFYGLGENRAKGTVDNRAMGGMSILADSIHLNFQNPAFYSNLALTTFTVGGTYNTTKLQSETDEERAKRTTLDYLAVAFPMGKFAGAFGLQAYSSVGYKIFRPATETETVERRYNGTGGINKVFAGGSYKFTDAFSAGVEFGYHFGRIETTSIYRQTEVQLGTRELNNSSASGMGFMLGVNYKKKIGKHHFLASATFSPQSTLSFSNERNIATVVFYTSGSYTISEDEDVPVADTEIKIPTKFSFGSGFGEEKKWMVGTELTFTQNSDLSNRMVDIENAEFENAIKWSVGGYYIPNYNTYSNYFKRIVYRAGFRYEKTGLVLNGESINDAGVSFGLGLPVGGSFSNINLSAEFGKRGTTNAGLVQENYASFSVALSLNDRWFVKRKYD